MNKLIIRKAAWEDLTGILKIKRQVHKQYVSDRPDLYRESLKLYTDDFLVSFFENDLKNISVGIIDDKIVAYIFLECIKVQLPMMVERKYTYIHDFAVGEAYRQQGIASKILTYTEKNAITNGSSKIELAVHLFSHDAMKLYEKNGFSPRAIRMEKNLTQNIH